MQAQTEVVTPEIAAEMLRHNTNNRRLRQTLVKEYAEAMSKGEWLENGEAIIISKSGALLDGQHRLGAVISYGKPVNFLIVRGVEDNAVKTMDVGRKRSIADHLEIDGFKTDGIDLLVTAAAIRLIMDFEGGEYRERKHAISPQRATKFLKDHPEIFEVQHKTKHSIRHIIPVSVAVALYYLCWKTHPEEADEFFYKLATGANLEIGNPILTLRNALTLVREGKGKANRRQQIALVLSAFRAHVEDRPLHRIMYRADAPVRLVA